MPIPQEINGTASDAQYAPPMSASKIGRVLLEQIFADSTMGQDANSQAGARMHEMWNHVSPHTKKIIFPNPSLRADLNEFFTTARKVDDIKGLGLEGADPSTMTQLMYNPKFVKELTNGMRLPAGSSVKRKSLENASTMLADYIKLNGSKSIDQSAPIAQQVSE